MINNNILSRTNELTKHINIINKPEDKVEAAAEWIKAKVSNSGISLVINFSIDPLFTSEFVSDLLPKLYADKAIYIEEICDTAIKVQCMNKIERIEKLNRIQRLMFELKDFNPSLIKKGMPKLSPAEQREIREILTFEK